MDRELEKYYNNYFDLFNTDGWKQLVKELMDNAQAINSVEATKDPNDLYLRKGQLNALAFIINLEDSVNNSYKELTEDVQDI